MAILIGRETKLLSIGITGNLGTFHTKEMISYGTNVVGGVNPSKALHIYEGVPVFSTVYAARKKTEANAAIIMVPQEAIFDSIVECIDSGIETIVCVSKGISVLDMIKVKSLLEKSNTRLIGPSSTGIIAPGESKVGIMPSHIHMPGKVGIVSRSGTLTYEVIYQLTQLEIGQSTSIGLGPDHIVGTSFIDCFELFQKDPDTDIIVMISDLSGIDEKELAEWVTNNMTKPIIAFFAGSSIPFENRVDYYRPVTTFKEGDEEIKKSILEKAGVQVAISLADLCDKISNIVKNQS